MAFEEQYYGYGATKGFFSLDIDQQAFPFKTALLLGSFCLFLFIKLGILDSSTSNDLKKASKMMTPTILWKPAEIIIPKKIKDKKLQVKTVPHPIKKIKKATKPQKAKNFKKSTRINKRKYIPSEEDDFLLEPINDIKDVVFDNSVRENPKNKSKYIPSKETPSLSGFDEGEFDDIYIDNYANSEDVSSTTPLPSKNFILITCSGFFKKKTQLFNCSRSWNSDKCSDNNTTYKIKGNTSNSFELLILHSKTQKIIDQCIYLNKAINCQECTI